MFGKFREGLGRVRSQVSVAVGLGATLIIIGTFLFHHLMDWTWEESFYFSVVTLTTVGYGDLTPDTGLQRIVIAIYVLIGVTIFVTAISIIGVNVIEKRQAELADRMTERNQRLHIRVLELEERINKFNTDRERSNTEEEPSPEEQEVT